MRTPALISLGRARDLVVPAGVHGIVASPLPDRVHEPVGFRDELYELRTLEAGAELGEVVEGTAAYDFFIRRVWVSGFNSMLQADPDAADVIFGSLDDAEVASNIGVWDADSRQILPPLIGAG